MRAQGRNTPQPSGGGAPASPVVAVIEDDPSFRRALSRSLNLRGFHTDVYASAEEYLRHRSADQADCIVLDIHLGGMSGFELQAELAAQPTPPPIIFITAFDDPATRRRALEAGAAGYLQKPFDDSSLIEVIDRVAPRRPPDDRDTPP
jgi:FixJ family two-component response regulator